MAAGRAMVQLSHDMGRSSVLGHIISLGIFFKCVSCTFGSALSSAGERMGRGWSHNSDWTLACGGGVGGAVGSTQQGTCLSLGASSQARLVRDSNWQPFAHFLTIRPWLCPFSTISSNFDYCVMPIQ